MKSNMFFGHIMPLILASHDADGIINNTITLLALRWLKWGVTWLFGHVTPLALASVLCDANGIINGTAAYLMSRQMKWGSTWLFGHLMPLALASLSHHNKSISNCITAFLSLRELKWEATWIVGCDTSDINIGITWCHWHWCHMMPLHWCQQPMMWTAPTMVPLHSLCQMI